jgi:hypothetical protein
VPDIRIRQAGYGDVAGIFQGSSYLCRLNKGELNLYNWRERVTITDEDLYLAKKGRSITQRATAPGQDADTYRCWLICGYYAHGKPSG